MIEDQPRWPGRDAIYSTFSRTTGTRYRSNSTLILPDLTQGLIKYYLKYCKTKNPSEKEIGTREVHVVQLSELLDNPFHLDNKKRGT